MVSDLISSGKILERLKFLYSWDFFLSCYGLFFKDCYDLQRENLFMWDLV